MQNTKKNITFAPNMPTRLPSSLEEGLDVGMINQFLKRGGRY